MIKRDYMVCGCVHKKDNSSFRPVWSHIAQTSWLPETQDLIEEFESWAGVKDDEALVIYSCSRLPRFI